MPGVTSAPKLQPIETRIVMLQSGFRAPMGIKVYGPTSRRSSRSASNSSGCSSRSQGPARGGLRRPRRRQAVSGDRDRPRADRPLRPAHRRCAGGDRGRHRRHAADHDRRGARALSRARALPARTARPARDARRHPRADAVGAQVPLRELAEIEYRRGPQMIRSENTFLVAYVLFDKRPATPRSRSSRRPARRSSREAIDSGA
jgi:copper/silver efflux system protein